MSHYCQIIKKTLSPPAVYPDGGNWKREKYTTQELQMLAKYIRRRKVRERMKKESRRRNRA